MASAVLFTLGTRGSALALAQARETRRRLAAAHGWDEARVAFAVIRTSGDLIQDRPLAEAGGKGLFTKEIDSALLDGRIDFAVHSAKDLPTALPDGVALAGFLPREDPRDALDFRARRLVRRPAPRREPRRRLAAPPGAGAAPAPRPSRRALARQRRDAAATRPRAARSTPRCWRWPASSGSASPIAPAPRSTSRRSCPPSARARSRWPRARATRATLEALAAIGDADTTTALAAERAFLAELEGSCRTPIAGYARLEDGRLTSRPSAARGRL